MTADQPGRRIEYLPLDDLVGAPRNPKRHDTNLVRASIARFGYTAPALRDERTGRLVVGHGRTEALRAMRDDGETPPAGITLDPTGRWLVPVIRGWASRSDPEAEAYLVADNQHTILGGWDDPQLGEVLADLAKLDAELLDVTGFDEADLEALLADEGGEDEGSGGDPDRSPPVPEQAVTQPGDVWLLGLHRLLCGDATNPQHLDLALRGLGDPGMVYTDPPYGISIVSDAGKVGHHRGMPFGGLKGDGKVIPTTSYLPVAGDETTQTAADAFRLLVATYPGARHVWWGGNHYAASADLPDSSCWLVWDKDTNGNFADAELAWTNNPGAVRLLRHMWNGMLRASERGKRVHPTQKPVALAEWAFTVVDPGGSARVVLDVFGGSGSTLLAAHRTDRVAAVIEMEPTYVDVICRRFQEHTGIVPILESTGRPVDFTTGGDT